MSRSSSRRRRSTATIGESEWVRCRAHRPGLHTVRTGLRPKRRRTGPWSASARQKPRCTSPSSHSIRTRLVLRRPSPLATVGWTRTIPSPLPLIRSVTTERRTCFVPTHWRPRRIAASRTMAVPWIGNGTRLGDPPPRAARIAGRQSSRSHFPYSDTPPNLTRPGV